MNHLPPPERYRTLTDDEKRAIIARAYELVPDEEGATVDQHGSIVKHFGLQNEPGFVSIYVPKLERTYAPGRHTSDCVWVTKRIPEELDNGVGLMYITNYMIGTINLSASRITDVLVFDTASGQQIKADIDPDKAVQIGIEEFHTQSGEITTRELSELTAMLDSIDPNDTFELPNA